MENEHLSQQTKAESQADKEWTEFERDLDTLGRQLASLQAHTAALGGQLVSSLEARFEEVKDRAQSFRRAKEQELEQMRLSAQQQAESTFSEARQRSTEAARQMWERSEPLRQGAKDVGEGLARAWTELRTSFGKAAGRLQTDATTNRPAPASGEDRRGTT